MSFNTPILFLIFNRPDTTETVFKRLKEIKPKYLYIAADGPRTDRVGEDYLCTQTRNIVLSSINWDCEVKTLFRSENLGCGLAVSKAITWFFENVEMGIIIEDDILAEPSFFPFCEHLLDKYKDNENVYSIGGTNVLGKWKNEIQDYHFSLQGSIWGWATWRRAWLQYRVDISSLNTVLNIKKVRRLSFKNNIFEHRKDLFFGNENVDTWDYQWLFIRLINEGLTIIPSVNLVSNIGFSPSATHTHNSNSVLSKMKTYPIVLPVRKSSQIKLDKAFENSLLRIVYPNTLKLSHFKLLIFRIRKCINFN